MDAQIHEPKPLVGSTYNPAPEVVSVLVASELTIKGEAMPPVAMKNANDNIAPTAIV
ncbi:MAG: hypothetical protein ABSE48_07020 [Verrucomicrobiota bacterium]